jgi:lipopolysaccharide export system permease protein
MRLLDRYLLRELLVPLVYCLAGFFIFWVSFDLFSGLEDFQRRHLTFGEILLYYVVTSPEQISLVMPIALLLGMLYALTNHSRHNEVTAMRAAGISLWRLSAPYFGVGLVFAVICFLLNELWVPRSEERGEDILLGHTQPGGNAAGRFWHTNVVFTNHREGRTNTWHLVRYHSRTHEMDGPTVISEDTAGERHRITALEPMADNGAALVQISARRGIYTNGAWLFQSASIMSFTNLSNPVPRIERSEELLLKGFSDPPAFIDSEIRVSSLTAIRAAKRPQLSLREIANYLALHDHLEPAQRALIETQWQCRLAAPWTCVVVVLIALPFGAATGRRNVFVGVAASIFICFAYFVLQRIGLSLGVGGHLSPWIAGWLPNIAFGAAGFWLMSRVR